MEHSVSLFLCLQFSRLVIAVPESISKNDEPKDVEEERDKEYSHQVDEFLLMESLDVELLQHVGTQHELRISIMHYVQEYSAVEVHEQVHDHPDQH